MADKRSVGRDLARLEDAVDDGAGQSWEDRARDYWEAKREAVLSGADYDDQPDMMDYFPDGADPERVRKYLQGDLTTATERVSKRGGRGRRDA